MQSEAIFHEGELIFCSISRTDLRTQFDPMKSANWKTLNIEPQVGSPQVHPFPLYIQAQNWSTR